MRHIRSLLLICLGAASVGCGATLTGGVVTDPNAPHPGIRYRVPEAYEVSVHYLVEEGNQSVVKTGPMKTLALPNPHVLREINYQGALLRSYTLTVNLRDNGTLSDVSLKGTGPGQAGAAGQALADAVKNAREAQDPELSEKRKLEQENALLEARKKNRELRKALGLDEKP